MRVRVRGQERVRVMNEGEGSIARRRTCTHDHIGRQWSLGKGVTCTVRGEGAGLGLW